MGGFCEHLLGPVFRTASLGIAPSLILSEVGDHEVGVSLAQKLKGYVEISHAFQPLAPTLPRSDRAQLTAGDARPACHLHSAGGGVTASMRGGLAAIRVTPARRPPTPLIPASPV